MMTLHAVYVMGDGGWVVAFVEEFSNIVTQGRTLEEARRRIREAVDDLLEASRELTEERISDRTVVLLRESFDVP